VLKRVGLECPSIHVLAADLGAPGEAPDSFKRAVHAAAVLGCKFICVPNFPAPASLSPPKAGADPFAYFLAAAAAMRADDWKRFASLLNERGDFLRRSGLLLAYHNHNVEFAPVEGVTGYDLLLAGTNPALVSFELDVGWVAAAGVDPLVLLRQQMGRFRLMHVKDIDRRTVPNFVARQVPATVGAGILPWASLLKAAVAAGVDQFFVEQEPPYTGSPLDAVRASYDYLAQLRA
jgi:sugar phosphate isomerase/epimerase